MHHRVVTELAGSLTLGALLEKVRERWGGYALVDHCELLLSMRAASFARSFVIGSAAGVGWPEPDGSSMITRGLMAFVVLVATLGCAAPAREPVREPAMLAGKPVAGQVSVVLRVSAAANETDDLGGTAALVEAVTDGLTDARIPYKLFLGADDHPPPPRIELEVERWNAGDRAARGGAHAAVTAPGTPLGGLTDLALAGGYEVLCKIYLPEDFDPTFSQRYTGSIMDSSESGSASNGRALGQKILDDALGRKQPEKLQGF